MDTDTVAIHESKKSDKVVKFIGLDKFTKDFREMYDNGCIYGCYIKNGEIVARDMWNNIHTNILN